VSLLNPIRGGQLRKRMNIETAIAKSSLRTAVRISENRDDFTIENSTVMLRKESGETLVRLPGENFRTAIDLDTRGYNDWFPAE